MDVTELMIGDYIQFSKEHSLPNKRTVFQVFGIRFDKEISNGYLLNVAFCDTGLVQYNYNPKVFEPIPLTAELLEKNGFIYNDLPFAQAWEQFGLSLYEGGDGFLVNCGQNVALRVNSIHQLQHVLRLAGINKEIVL